MAEAFSGDVWRPRYLEVSPRLSYEDVLRQAQEYEQKGKEYPETPEGRDGEKFARQFVEDIWGSPKALQAGKYGDHILKSDVVLRLPEAGTFAALQVSVAQPSSPEGHDLWERKKVELLRNPAPYVGALVPPEIRSQLSEDLARQRAPIMPFFVPHSMLREVRLAAQIHKCDNFPEHIEPSAARFISFLNTEHIKRYFDLVTKESSISNNEGIIRELDRCRQWLKDVSLAVRQIH